MIQKTILTLVGTIGLGTSLLAQTATPNAAAVDTLTKEVAIAVFEKIDQPKAQDIYNQLLECGDGCDPQMIIRTVGSWDQVGAKLEELSVLKNTQRFQALPPAEANAAIRKQLLQFYIKHKAEKPYSVPLTPAVQLQILAKIDGLLPPGQPDPAQPATDQPATAEQPAVDAETGLSDEGNIDPVALQMSRLERAVKEEQEKSMWMIIASGLVGLIVGAGAVYWLGYRSLKSDVDGLTAQNSRLAAQLDQAQRSKPTNTPRPPQNQPDYKTKAEAYDTIRAELGTDPLAAIRQLKQSASQPASPAAPAPPANPVVEASVRPEPAPVPMSQSQVTPPPVRNEVLYFPPPSPNGLFDSGQQMPALSPESAYRFSISADKPDVATFSFEAEPGRVTRLLTYRNYMIEPACDSENSYSSQHTRIVNRRDGEAVRENGGWRVVTKALIRYE
ncbi:hypothetical protein [Spirosoma sp. 209]|uniref:hypothetical protein n=1 Tax=Spirosoma sp. 209 TaxID=1955701 RepID=UPI00098D32FC|nr:hypothetical protein [Spirosoma sp. 209]